jgi:predicted transposase YdaD
MLGGLLGRGSGGDKTMGNVWLDAIDDQKVVERQEGREEGRQEGRKEGLEKGAQNSRDESARNFATRLLKRGNDSLDEIADLVELDIEEIKAIQEEMAE